MIIRLSITILGLFCIIRFGNSQDCECKCKTSNILSSGDETSAAVGAWVVRPKSLPKPSVTLPLYGSTYKGPCIRSQTVVKPAALVNPVYLQESTAPTSTNGSPSPFASAPSRSHVKLEGYQPIDVSKAYQQACRENICQPIPADAVSLAIAYKLAQKDFETKIFEDKLSYGFKKLPAEVPCPKKAPQRIMKTPLPEQSLYTINGEVVELKPLKKIGDTPEDLEEEAIEDMVDLFPSEEESDQAAAIKKPSLTELGYGPAKIKTPIFVNVPTYVKPQAQSQAGTNANCKDGFQPGSVVVKDT